MHERLLYQEQLTDENGTARLSVFSGEQALWAEKDGLASLPWVGHEPARATLTLGPAFTMGGRVSMPELDHWDPDYVGERRILVSGLHGKLWRPLARVRDVGEGEWGPLVVPLAGIARIRARFEGLPIVPIEEEFSPPPPLSRKRIDFHAEKQADLWFKVQDEAGQPVPTARGLVWWGSNRPGSAMRAEGATRPDGTMYIGSFPPGTIYFEVTAPGYGSYEGTGVVPSEGILVDLPRGGRVVGRCVHAREPVTDFEVIYWREGRVRLDHTQAFLDREDGSFDLGYLEIGDWWLTASSSRHPAGRPITIRVVPDQRSEVELQLPTAVRGVGRVVDADTGDPITQASVLVYSSGGMEKGPAWGVPVPVSVDGSFELDAFVEGSNYIRVEAEGYADVDAKAVLVSQDVLDWGDVHMHRPQTLIVTLTGLEELTSFLPSQLLASAIKGHVLPETPFSSDGIVRFDGVPPGECDLFLTRPDEGWTRLQLRLEAGKEWNFEHRIAGGRKLAVRLSNVPKLRFDPQVFVTHREEDGTRVARENSIPVEGWYHFEGLTTPTVRVQVIDHEGKALASENVSFGSDLSREVELSLGEAPFRVRVVDGDDEPLAGAWVTVRQAGAATSFGLDDTDGEGWASIQGVPEGPVLVDVRHALAGLRPGIPIDASVREHEIRFEATGALELLVVDGEEPLAGVSVRILVGKGTLGTTETGEHGHARFELLGEGAYTLALTRVDCWPVSLEVPLAAGERAQRTVQVRRLADLELTVLSRDGLPVSGLPVQVDSLEFGVGLDAWLAEGRITAEESLRTSSSGKLHASGLPRGPYSWTTTIADEAFTGTFELLLGKTNSIRVMLAR